MRVEDVMTKEVVSVSLETRITEIAEILFENRFHGVPVVDDEGKVIGIVTESDFFTNDSRNIFLPSYINFLEETGISSALTNEKQKRLKELMDSRAKDIMSSDCVTILEDMKLEDLLNFFRETGFTTLPVTDEKNNLRGIVTLADILGLVKSQK